MQRVALSAGWFGSSEASLDTQSWERIASVVHQAARRCPYDAKVLDLIQGRLQEARIARGEECNGRRRRRWWQRFIISWSPQRRERGCQAKALE
jgi:hypothetical protein